MYFFTTSRNVSSNSVQLINEPFVSCQLKDCYRLLSHNCCSQWCQEKLKLAVCKRTDFENRADNFRLTSSAYRSKQTTFKGSPFFLEKFLFGFYRRSFLNEISGTFGINPSLISIFQKTGDLRGLSKLNGLSARAGV